jgi:hypothetical protein
MRVAPKIQALEILPTKSLKSPPLVGLLPQAKSLRVPNLVILRPAVPKFSVRSRHYSRFLEKRIGDWVRPHCVADLALPPTRKQRCIFS